MQADIVWNMINNLNQQSVPFSNNNSRTRELPIHGDHAFCVAQPRNVCQPYLQK